MGASNSILSETSISFSQPNHHHAHHHRQEKKNADDGKEATTTSVTDNQELEAIKFISNDPRTQREFSRVISRKGKAVYLKTFREIDAMQRKVVQILHQLPRKESDIAAPLSHDTEQSDLNEIDSSANKERNMVLSILEDIRSFSLEKYLAKYHGSDFTIPNNIRSCLSPLQNRIHQDALHAIEKESPDQSTWSLSNHSIKRLILQWYDSVSKAQDRLLTIIMDELDEFINTDVYHSSYDSYTAHELASMKTQDEVLPQPRPVVPTIRPTMSSSFLSVQSTATDALYGSTKPTSIITPTTT